MRGLHAGKNIRVKPYALTSGSRVTTKPMDGDFQGGVDVKYGVTSGLVWDFTVNTDFSQVEADEQQVNLTRFNLFFPEKRDFFLENQGIFAFGRTAGGGGGGGNFGAGRTNQVQDMRLFFTRRIGLSDNGQALPILAGTRLSGRAGRATRSGVLNIQQREDQGRAGDQLHRAAAAPRRAGELRRRRRRCSTRKSADLTSTAWPGFDANFRFGDLQLNGFAAKTFSPDSARRRRHGQRP